VLPDRSAQLSRLEPPVIPALESLETLAPPALLACPVQALLVLPVRRVLLVRKEMLAKQVSPEFKVLRV
jgi:hypothetical protein